MKSSDSGGAVMVDMGVDIRVPSGWVVESAAVEGKKCIGTHSGSCKHRARVTFSGMSEMLCISSDCARPCLCLVRSMTNNDNKLGECSQTN